MAENVDSLCEFRPGDIIIEIDGATTYRVIGSYQTTSWYLLEGYREDFPVHTQLDKSYIDSKFVKIGYDGNMKVGHRPVEIDKDFYAKLTGMWANSWESIIPKTIDNVQEKRR